MPNPRRNVPGNATGALRPGAWRRALLPPAVWLISAAAAVAQAPAQPGGAGQTQVIRPGPSLFGEVLLVLVMCGLALFAVCRSSRRN